MGLDGKTILVTGGTGSFGKQFVEIVLAEYQLKKLIVFSRDEFKQHEMRLKYPDTGYSPIRYFIGDVRDRDRLNRAFYGVDLVVHAAALRQLTTKLQPRLLSALCYLISPFIVLGFSIPARADAVPR